MTRSRHERVRRRRALPLLAAGLVPAVVLAPATPALAHTELVGSTPAAGAQLPAPPTQVRLDFNQAVEPQLARIGVSAGGAAVQEVTATVTGTTVTAALPDGSDAAAGPWQLSYRVVSADGHPVSGTVSFMVQPQAATTPTASATPVPVASPSPSAATSSPAALDPELSAGESSTGPTLWPWVAAGVVLLAGGGWWLRRRSSA